MKSALEARPRREDRAWGKQLLHEIRERTQAVIDVVSDMYHEDRTIRSATASMVGSPSIEGKQTALLASREAVSRPAVFPPKRQRR